MRWKTATMIAVIAVMAAPAAAYASTVTTWDGNGGENLPCLSGGHWVLSPAQGITDAVLTVNGVSYVMSQNGQGSFAVDSAEALDGALEASADYNGENESAFLKLSHCLEGEPSPTVTPSPSVSPSATPTPTETSPPPTSTSTSTSPPSTGTHTGPPSSMQPSFPPTAMTGVSSKALLGYAAIIAVLLVIGSWLVRKGSSSI